MIGFTVETRFAETLTLTLHPNFGETGFGETGFGKTGFGESGRHRFYGHFGTKTLRHWLMWVQVPIPTGAILTGTIPTGIIPTSTIPTVPILTCHYS